jgi:hypothetical protein
MRSKLSRNWFMTGHSTPSAIKMPAAWITETGSDCSLMSIITANGLTLSLTKPNKVQNLQVSTVSPGTKCYQITFAVFKSLWQVSTLRLNTLQPLWNCHYFAKNGIAEENQLFGNVEEIRCDRRFRYIRDRCNRGSCNDKQRETAREWKNDPL